MTQHEPEAMWDEIAQLNSRSLDEAISHILTHDRPLLDRLGNVQ